MKNKKRLKKTKKKLAFLHKQQSFVLYILQVIKTLPHVTQHILIQTNNQQTKKYTNTLYHESADFWRHPIKFMAKIHTVLLLGRTTENVCKYFYEPKGGNLKHVACSLKKQKKMKTNHSNKKIQKQINFLINSMEMYTSSERERESGKRNIINLSVVKTMNDSRYIFVQRLNTLKFS